MQMVLLRHELPDGTWHFDWMIEAAAGRGLVTFRVGVRVDDPGTTQFDGERIGEHRREYLNFEGPLSGGRGVVARFAMGNVESVKARDGQIEVRGDFGGQTWVWTGIREGRMWRFERAASGGHARL